MPNAKVISSLIAIALVTQLGCAPMWARVRENEREFAVDSARAYSKRGDCVQTLDSLDRAEARLDIGTYGREATTVRVRCYEKLGRYAASRAHRRLLADFYDIDEPALPQLDGGSVFRVRDLGDETLLLPPATVKIISPSYSAAARRSKIVGRVVIAFSFERSGRPTKIRVLEMPHPLLATWAIEAIEKSGLKKKAKGTILPTDVRFVTTFVFSYRWATPKEEPGGP